MKLARKFLYFILLLLVSAPLIAGTKTGKFTIVHTNDLHSHLLGFSPNIDYTPATVNDDKTKGGWARIATVIKSVQSEKKNPVLVLDAGDFLMGSLFHMVSREYSFELRLMKEMGYDVVTLGNHEFDLMPRGLARILESGNRMGGTPTIVSSNLVFSKESKKDDTLEAAYKKGLFKSWHVIEKDGITFGFFGLVGHDAAEVSPFASPVTFADPVTRAREMVKILKGRENVDVVICLSHSGLSDDKEKSEDEILAREVDGIDIIISGHTHTNLMKPLFVNNTVIVQAWAYGRHAGVLDMAIEKGRKKMTGYRIVSIDDSIKGDPAITASINRKIGGVNMKVLKYFGLGFYSPVAETDFPLALEEDECNLGNLIADSIRYYGNRFVYDPKNPASKIDIGVISGGVIRDNIVVGKTGKIAVCDLFRTIPLGIGMDDTMAYPLITINIYAFEIKRALEILTSIYPMKGGDYFLQISGVKFTYNPNRMLFDRVTEIWIGDEESGYKKLDYSDDNKKLYTACADIYNATFLKIVCDYTMDILKIIPKDEKGNPVTDLVPLRIDIDKKKEGIQEAKEWVGLLEYVRSFKDTDGDGIPNIPEKYKGKLGRIVAVPSWNPVSLLSGGTYVTWLGLLGLVIGTVIAVFILRFVAKMIRKLAGK